MQQGLSYENGLSQMRALLEQGDSTLFHEFLALEARLRESLRDDQLYGASENVRSQRAAVVYALNELALRTFGMSFNEVSALSELKIRVTEVVNLLSKPEVSIVNIYGMPGSGKTFLARAIVDHVQQSQMFTGGVVWIDCTVHNSWSRIVDAIAIVMRVQLEANRRWRVLEKLAQAPALLVFDPFEDVSQDDELLSFVARLPSPSKALVVTRERIRISPRREAATRLGGLSIPETTSLLRRLLPTAGEKALGRQTIEKIHHITGGLPFAVVLLARVLDKERSWDRVLSDLKDLETTDEVLEHLLQQVALSLSDTQREILDGLSVFAARVSSEAVRGVVAALDVEASLTTLVASGLVSVIDGQYTLHPIVQTFLRRQLDPFAREGLENRMIQFFLEYADAHRQDFTAIDREWFNIRYAMELAYQNALWSVLRDLMFLLGEFLDARGYSDDYILWLNRAIEASEVLGDERSRAAFLHNLAVQHQRQDRFDLALHEYQQSLSIARKVGDRHAEATTLSQLGLIYRAEGRLDDAITQFRRVLEISLEIGDRYSGVSALSNLGLILADQGNLSGSLGFYEQALAISREVGDSRVERNSLTNIGLAHARMGEIQRALSYYEQALTISRQIGDRRGEAADLRNRGVSYRLLGSVQRAIGDLEQALAIYREIGDRYGEERGLLDLGLACADWGDMRRAVSYLEQALTISQEIDDRRSTSTLLTNLGIVYANLGDMQKAVGYLERARVISEEVGDLRALRTEFSNLGTAYAALGETQKAIDHLKQALRFSEQMGDRDAIGPLLTNLAAAYADLGETLLAVDYLEQALRIYPRETSPNEWTQIALGLSTMRAEAGNWLAGKDLAAEILLTFRAAQLAADALPTLASWFLQMSELAVRNHDYEFAVRVLADAAHRFEIEGIQVPDTLAEQMAQLKTQVGDDLFAIVAAEAQGVLTPGLALALQEAGEQMERQRFDEATARFTDALQLLSDDEKTEETQRQRAVILSLRGICLRHLERWEEALVDQGQAFSLFERVKDVSGEARSVLEMGHLFELMNNYEESRLHYMDAYRLYKRTGDARGMAAASEHLGRLEFRTRMPAQAVQDLEEARSLWIQVGEQGRVTAIEADLEDARAMLAHQSAGKGK